MKVKKRSLWKRKIRWTPLVLGTLLWCAFSSPLWAEEAANGAGPAIQVGSADQGASLYKRHCLSCHGTDLRGKIGPDLSKAGARYSADQLRAVIGKGRGAMPGFAKQLSSEEIRALSVWLAAHK